MQTNELNMNAMGGTELMASRLGKHFTNKQLEPFQIISSRVRDLHPLKKKILWLHDLPGDPEVMHLMDGGYQEFDKLVFVSHWQQNAYAEHLGVPHDVGVVIENAIEPFQPYHKLRTDKIRLIYYSTPHRGLDILYHAFDYLCKMFDNIELTVYSSFDLYGWPQRDEEFKDLFKLLEDHPHITYHKSVPNDEIRRQLRRHDILAYPCIWPETSCLVLMEAMSAGLDCIHSSLAALPETSGGLTGQYGFVSDKQKHLERFTAALAASIQGEIDQRDIDGLTEVIVDEAYNIAKYYADEKYNTEIFADKWRILFDEIK